MSFAITKEEEGTAVVTLGGELDLSNIAPVEAAVADVIQAHPRRLVVDVSRLRFADSSAIALWLRWAASVDTMELRNVPPLLRHVIASMGLRESLGLRQ